MSVIAPVITSLETIYGHADSYVWTLANGDSGAPSQLPGSHIRSLQVSGTFGTGGTVIAEGSNMVNAATYAPLTDTTSTAISFTAAGIKRINEPTAWFRPRCTGGDGTTAVVCSLVVTRAL